MSNVDEERLKKALALCNLAMPDDALGELCARLSGVPLLGHYNTVTGDVGYAEGTEDNEGIQCLKRTLASEPEDTDA